MTIETKPKNRNRGIPTTYRGTRFRSRLEARWAAFFDLVGWSWVYEPFDTEGWIPDFLIRGAFPFLVEVGPCVSASEYYDKGEKPRAAYPPTPTLVGPPGDQVRLDLREYWTLVVGVTPVYEEPSWVPGVTAPGTWAVDAVGHPRDVRTLPWGFWEVCSDCGGFGVDSPDYGSYARPCGHATEVMSQYTRIGRKVFDLWSTAGNKTQWRGR